jgi:hypothetical protein
LAGGNCPTLKTCVNAAGTDGYYQTARGIYHYDPRSGSSITSAASQASTACF